MTEALQCLHDQGFTLGGVTIDTIYYVGNSQKKHFEIFNFERLGTNTKKHDILSLLMLIGYLLNDDNIVSINDSMTTKTLS